MFDCRTDSNQKTGFSIRVDYVDSDCPIKKKLLFVFLHVFGFILK